MLHPTLYPRRRVCRWRNRSAHRRWCSCSTAAVPAAGRRQPPEAASGSDLPRSDIIAQALRLRLLLHSSATLDAARRAHLDALVQALLYASATTARWPSCPARPRRNPTWCGLFAEQALRCTRWSEG